MNGRASKNQGPPEVVYLDHDEAPGNYRQATDANGEARWSGLPSGLVSAKARGQDGTISSKDSGRLGWYGRRQLRLELVLD